MAKWKAAGFSTGAVRPSWRDDMNVLEGAALFVGMAHAYEKNVHDALEGASKIIEKESKSVIGSYRYGWPQLADETQDDRVRKGYPANEPLLRTGDMRNSIEYTILTSEKKAYVGSNDDKAVWQELGTSRGIPPRSFLGGAAMRKGEEVAHYVGGSMFRAITATGNGYGYSHWEPGQTTTLGTALLPP